MSPRCVLNSLCLSLQKKKVWEKEQKKNRYGKDRRKNIFVLAAGINPNNLILLQLQKNNFHNRCVINMGQHFIFLELYTLVS